MRAAVFAGQGTQRVGMAAGWRNDPVGAPIFAVASDVLGYDLAQRCARGPEAALRDTACAQPAVVATGVAAWLTCRSLGFDADVVAGHSVGELAALVAAGSIEPADAIELTARRGLLMSALPPGGAMASFLGLDVPAVEAACANTGDVVVAVVNGPDDIVVSGAAGAVGAMIRWATERGTTRATPLRVSHAFHSPLMAPMEAEWQAVVDRARIVDPIRVHLSSVTGTVLATAAEIRDALVRQLVSPVRWDLVGMALAAAGVAEICQLGDDRSLCRLARRGEAGARTAAIAQRSDLRALAAGVEG